MIAVQDVTAIVPTFNRAEYLGECLSSLLGQTTPARQVIVIDDGSTDATAGVVKQFGDRIDYLRQENAGKSAALNRALHHAVGANIWIFDDDDVADPQALSLLSGALEHSPGAGFSFGGYDNFTTDQDGAKTFTAVQPPAFGFDDLHFSLLMHCSIFQAAMLVRRRCYDEVGPFDTTFPRAQDYEMLLRLSQRFEAARVDAILFHQRQHVGTRGPAHLRISGAEVWRRQGAFDAMVLQKVHRTNALRDYLPLPERVEPLSPALCFKALMRRSAAMARRYNWALAADDLREASRIAPPGDAGALSPEVSDAYRNAADQSAGFGEPQAENALSAQAKALPPSRLRNDVLAALSWPMLRHGIKRGLSRDWRLAGDLLRHYADLADIPVLLRHGRRAADKAARKAGLRKGDARRGPTRG